MELISLYNKVPLNYKTIGNNIKTTYSMLTIKKCIEFNVANYYAMNFRDLEYLITLLDIDKVKSYLSNIESEELQKRGISKVVHVSGSAAMQM